MNEETTLISTLSYVIYGVTIYSMMAIPLAIAFGRSLKKARKEQTTRVPGH